MAIQNRRGVYNDFDPSKMVEGEFAVVKSGDPNTNDGTAVYISTATGSAKRVALYQDIVQEVQSATDEIADDLVDQINEGVAENVTAAQNAANTATQAASDISASAAQITTNTNDITDLKEDLSDIERSLGSETITPEVTVGGSIDITTGGDTTNESYSRIEYIDVSNISSLDIGINGLGVYWYTYNAYHQQITHSGWYYENTTINTDAASYVRMVVRHPMGQTATSPTIEEIEEGITIKSRINTEINDNISELNSDMASVKSTTNELVISTDEIINSLGGNTFEYSITVGGSIDINTGGDATSPSYSRIDYIDVSGYSNVSVDVGTLGAYWYTYDSEKNHIAHAGWMYEDFTIDTSNVDFIRIVIRHPLGQTATPPTEAEILANVKICANIIDVHSKITELEAGNTIVNQHMKQNFIPAKSSRFIYAKGKMWEEHWNTAEAFEAAARDSRCWGISIDVRWTSDGYAVCFHDPTIDNHTDGTGAIEDKTWAEVQEINVDKGVWNGGAWGPKQDGTTAKIPLVTSALNICRKYGKIAIIEPKAKGSAAVANLTNSQADIVMGWLKDRGMIDSCAFIAPPVTQLYLYNNYKEVYRFRLVDANITKAWVDSFLYDPNTVYGAYNSGLTEELINYIHQKDRFVLGYTPRTNPQSDDVEMLAKNLDGIFVFREPPTL